MKWFIIVLILLFAQGTHYNICTSIVPLDVQFSIHPGAHIGSVVQEMS